MAVVCRLPSSPERPEPTLQHTVPSAASGVGPVWGPGLAVAAKGLQLRRRRRRRWLRQPGLAHASPYGRIVMYPRP